MYKYSIWEERGGEENVALEEKIAQELNIDRSVARLIVRRGIASMEEARAYLFSDEEKLFNPFLFTDMQTAVQRIRGAMQRGEHIVICGDYDADGIMGTSILYTALKSTYEKVGFYLPDRFKDGYGLNKNVVDDLQQRGCKLIITVDNGISAVAEVSYAAQLGMNTIITDHHEAPDELPRAVAILNPKVVTEKYPNKDLCGAGVAYKLAMALIDKGLCNADKQTLLTFAMIGTVADIVPLVGENRHITAMGLQAARKTRSAALIQMLADAGIKPDELEAGHIGYRIAPRINAAGRMTNANEAVRMFCSDPPEEAREKAALLGKINTVRQQKEKEIYEEADAIVQQAGIEAKKIWVIAKKGWHEGVIGITAGRLAEAYNRPFLLISINEDGSCKGSARSIVGFNIYEAILSAADCLERFGGHSAAAGFSLREEQLEVFDEKLNAYAEANDIQRHFRFKRLYDALSERADFSEKHIAEMGLLAPFGYKNPKPVLRLNGCEIFKITAMGSTGEHVSCTVLKDGHKVRGVAFSQAERFAHMRKGDAADILFYPVLNSFRNVTTIEYEIKEIFFYEALLDAYQKAFYRHFIAFYQQEMYLPDAEPATLRVEDALAAEAFDVVVAYSYEMLKRIQRYLRYSGREAEWEICFNEIAAAEADKRYVLMCPTKLPTDKRVAVSEYNAFGALEETLYRDREFCVLRMGKAYRDNFIRLDRSYLAFVFTHLSELEKTCANRLTVFIAHLNAYGKHPADSLNVQLALDVFASLGLLEYTYNAKKDLFRLKMLPNKEKKDLFASDIMVKLYDIQKKNALKK